MIKIYTGDDRIRAKQEITKFLGTDYEIIDGPDIDLRDLPTIFFGTSLLASHRRIMIRDLAANKPAFDALPEYLATPHDIALFESKLDKRSATYKAIKPTVDIYEFKLPEPDFREVFDIYRIAKQNGPKALELLARVKSYEDPIMFTGLLASQAIKDYTARQGIKEKRILSALAAADLQMKTTGMDPWLIIESFLLRLSRI